MNATPRYATNSTKIVECLVFLASEHPGIDVYQTVKALFFADKEHVARYGRPIAGDEYRAAQWGPLAQTAYKLLNRGPIEILSLEGNREVPFSIDGAQRVAVTRGPDMDRLSQSDVEALRFGLARVIHRTFDEIYEETHADHAYINADGGMMDVRDFISDSDPDAEEKRLHVAESTRGLVF